MFSTGDLRIGDRMWYASNAYQNILQECIWYMHLNALKLTKYVSGELYCRCNGQKSRLTERDSDGSLCFMVLRQQTILYTLVVIHKRLEMNLEHFVAFNSDLLFPT